MKKMLIAAGALVLIAGVSQAQTTENKDKTIEHHRHGGFRQGKDFGKDLNLNEDQKKQFKEINDSYHKQVIDIRNNKSLSADEVKAKTQALRKEQFGKTQAVLTAEQKAIIAEKRKTTGGREFHKGRTAMQEGRHAGQLKEKLGLSDDQTAKLESNRQAFHEKAKAIHGNASLTDEQKKEQVKALARQNHESMRSVLTPAQLEKLKAGRKHKNGSK
ncbi:hypothetical protein [Sediminibacterium soli]|uniref:hypothetical protein n=1 Tax=Sediminibacterium soli TaxID=2698829 RepID=UPI00137AB328|nr:hypothetical protein [Sediminibacterium soli]NCI47473.1 hypothetical protein [Sediminibacterium soli]